MLRSWWQKIKQHPVATGVIGFVVVVVIALVFAVVWFNGTGFDGYNQVTIAHTISGPSAGTVTRTEVYQPGKSLWDWLQLLIIPVVLVVGGFLLNYTMSRNEQAISSDNQREQALQAYINSMSELLLEKHLREFISQYENVRQIARVRTLTVLSRLDGRRKASVLKFLYESGLINKGMRIIDLNGADLKDADLLGAKLSGADLSGVYLNGANLFIANLSEADLSETDLRKANLNDANLIEANLSVAYLKEAHLLEADLTNANLLEANLNDANLTGAILKKAILKKAILIGVDLSKADLTEAYLQDADLTGAKVTTEQLDKAISL